MSLVGYAEVQLSVVINKRLIGDIAVFSDLALSCVDELCLGVLWAFSAGEHMGMLFWMIVFE